MIGGLVVRAFRWLARHETPRWADGFVTWCVVAALIVYRRVVSRFSGRECMFQPTCSARALAVLRARGWSQGRLEVLAQLDRCDGNFVMMLRDDQCVMHTSDGEIFGEGEIARHLVDRHRRAFAASTPHRAGG